MSTVHQVQFVRQSIKRMRYAPRGWLDMLRWKIVTWLGGENPYDTVKVTRIPIDAEKFMEKVWLQKRYLFEAFNQRPQTLLIGAEDYEEMMSSPEITQSFVFEASYNFGERQIQGLTVKVIPWMRGAVVMS